MRAMLAVLGLDPLAEHWARRRQRAHARVVDALVAVALDQRQAARERKDYAAADAIRDELLAAGIVVEDTPDGPRWELRPVSARGGSRAGRSASRASPARAPAATAAASSRARARPRPRTCAPGIPRSARRARATAARCPRRRPGRWRSPSGARGPRNRHDESAAAGSAAEVVAGRNAVLESLRAGVPAIALHVGPRLDADERIGEAVMLAADTGVPWSRPGGPSSTGSPAGAVHQGLVLRVRPYEYAHPDDLVAAAARPGSRR